MIVKTSLVQLDAAGSLRRTPPRPQEDRQPGYEEKFDDLTIFYDAFNDGSGIVLSGPPLLNLADHLRQAEFFLDGVRSVPVLSDMGRTQRSGIAATGDILRVSSEHFDFTIPILQTHTEMFEGRRVLTTLSKNNPLRWIREWAEFYAKVHDVDAILIYDNRSDEYSQDDLDAALSEVDGIEVVGVVDWPAKHGAGAGPAKVWDSNFLQTSAFEHARFRFLARASQVINADVDELVLTEDERPLHEHLAESPSGGLIYKGRWIEAAETIQDGSFADYYHYDSEFPASPLKWTIIPSRSPMTTIWDTHGFRGWHPERTSHVMYRHFRPISTDWKYRRRDKTRDPAILSVDEQLRALTNRVFRSVETSS